MTNQVQHQSSSSSIWWIRLHPATTGLAVGTVLLSAVTAARSQEEKAAKPPAYSVLYTFTDGADGANPNVTGADTALVLDRKGNLYGTTWAGGEVNGNCSFGCGVAFKLNRAGQETVLHSFTGTPDGAAPVAGLVRDEQGNLYGTTVADGTYIYGTVFKLDRFGKETVLYSFTGSPDGEGPAGNLLLSKDKSLYGTTPYGGVGGRGVVFKLDRDGKETVLYAFTGMPDGDSPYGGLTEDEEGNFYGTTTFGGAYNSGTVFKLDRHGNETVLYSFTGKADGQYPDAGLIRDWEGNFYGDTYSGGVASTNPLCNPSGCGVVFKLDPDGKETVLYRFSGGTDGAGPAGRLIQIGADLYGNTGFGGDISAANPLCDGVGCGVVFKLNPDSGKETVLYAWTGAADGASPYVGLVQDEAGNLYGTAGYGGDLSACSPFGCGVVFKLKPRGEDDEDSARESSTGTTQDIAAPDTQHPTASTPGSRVPTGQWDRSRRGGPWYRIPGPGTGPRN